MILLLALRNIFRSKKHSLIIVTLIGVITFLFFAGNSILARSSRALKQSYIESLTGDLIIEKQGDVTMNLFGANAPIIDEYFSIPVLPAYDAIFEQVRAMPEVAALAGQVSTKAVMEYEGKRSPALISGVNGDDYFALFPAIQLEEGHFLRNGESGVMLTKDAVMRYGETAGRQLAIGDPLLFTAAGQAGFKIREAPLVGIFSYRNPGRFMNDIVITNVQTARVLSQIQVAGAAADVSGGAVSLLEADEDALFWGSETEAPDNAHVSDTSLFDTLDLDTALAGKPDAEEETAAAADEGAAAASGGDWNFIILRLKPGTNAGVFAAKLNKALHGYGAAALGWRFAAGGSAIIVLMLSALFNGGIFLVSAAGIIAIVNILLIAVFRRTQEIGTLRAIGAADGYIRALVLCENSLLGLAAGAASCVFGAFFFALVNGLDIYIHNDILANLLGGSVLNIEFSAPLAALSVVVALVLSVLASIYPVETAVKIEPIVALRQG